MANYEQYAGTKLSSDHVEDVLAAANQGKVESLFVNVERHRWGKFDPISGMIEQHRNELPGDADLLNIAAIETLKNRGDVYSLDSVDPREILAVFRY